MRFQPFLLAPALLALFPPANAAPATSPIPRVLAVDEGGRERVVPSILLSPDRIGIPVKTLQELGFTAKYNAQDGQVYLSTPPPTHAPPGEGRGATRGFKSGEHGVYNSLSGQLSPTTTYPVALNRAGKFYVSVSVAAQLLPSLITQWNQNTHTLTLRRRTAYPQVW